MVLASLAAWCAALFLAATLFSHTVALRLLLLLAGIGLVCAAAAHARFGPRRAEAAPDGGIAFLPPLLVPLALWAAWAALSLSWSLEPALSEKEFRNEIVYAILAYWLCHAGAQAAPAARAFGAALGLGALAVGIVALQYLGEVPPGARFMHGGPGTYSSTLLTLLPCTLAFLWLGARRHWHPALLAFAALLLPLYAVSGYATQNRTLWVGVAVQFALVGWFILQRGAPGRTKGKSLAMAIAILAVSAGALTAGSRVHFERIGSADVLAGDPRVALWESVLRRVEERPLAGAGFGRGIARHDLRSQTGNAQLWHSHNLFVDTAYQLGVVGVALLVLLLGCTARLAWRLMRSRDDVAAACGLALAAVLAGMLIRNMTDVLWVRQSALLYWGVVGALLGWGLRAERAAAR